MMHKRKIRRACGHRYNYLLFDHEEKGFNDVDFSSVLKPSREPVPSGVTFNGIWQGSTGYGYNFLHGKDFPDDQDEPEQLPERDPSIESQDIDLQDWLEED
jgi:hypothetical protein